MSKQSGMDYVQVYDFTLPKPTHRITINCAYRSRDSKSFSIFSDKTTDELITILKQFIGDTLNERFRETIKFSNEIHKRHSHYISVLDISIMKSQSFRVSYPSYSSYEIADEVYRHLCGGKELA